MTRITQHLKTGSFSLWQRSEMSSKLFLSSDMGRMMGMPFTNYIITMIILYIFYDN